MPKIDVDSADIQLLSALRGWVEDKVSDLVGAVNSNGHAPDDDDDDDVPASGGGNTWSRAELDAMQLKELRQLAKDLGCPSLKKTEIFDWLEKKKKIRDEDADDTDVNDDDDDTPDVEDSSEDEDDESEDEADEEGEGDVTFEDLLDKEKFPFKDLLEFAKENGVKVSKEERVPKASNRRKIAERLVAETGDDDEDE